jgi:hypothetical protein
MPIEEENMDGCAHGMEPAWCYLCRIEASGADPAAAWGVMDGPDGPWEHRTGPMAPRQLGYLRFLCGEFAEGFDPSLTEGEASVVIESFLNETMSGGQEQTLRWLSQRARVPFESGMTYGQARSAIRRLVASRGLKSA